MKRFIIEKSHDLPGWWVVTDSFNNVVLRFMEGDYNGTQKVTFLNDDAASMGAAHLARVLREIGEYVVRHHGSIAFPQPYGYEYSEDDSVLYLYRRKYPRWRIELHDDVDRSALAASLRKAAEWVIKGNRKDR